jgi:uncharacterized protein (DUF427 family)
MCFLVYDEIEGELYADIVWWYEYPVHQSAAVQGLIFFYNQKVNISVDGALEQK